MRYWILIEGEVSGPFEKEKLLELEGFGPNVLVCPEGKSPKKRWNWKLARLHKELAELMGEAAPEELASTAQPIRLSPARGLSSPTAGGPPVPYVFPKLRRPWAGTLFLCGLFVVLAFSVGRQWLREKPTPKGTEKPGTPIAGVLDFYIPRRKMTVREALGNPRYKIDALQEGLYFVELTPARKVPSSLRRPVVLEYDSRSKSVSPRNKEARILLGLAP